MNTPQISMIAALSENGVIGNKGRIPWHIKDDLLRFKHITMHHTIILGRKTFDSLLAYYEKSGRPLPPRNNIVITRDTTYSSPHAIVVHSIEAAIEKGKEIEKKEIFISGGGEIYNQAIVYAQKLYLTIVKGEFEGDAFFPDYSAFTKIVNKEEKEANGLQYTFLDIER